MKSRSTGDWQTFHDRLKNVATNVATSVGVTGAAIATGDDIGAHLAGSAVIPALSWGLAELIDRRLTKRERYRAVTVLTYASKRLDQLVANGKAIRADGFFDSLAGGNGRSSGEQILEGVLLASQREHEELKLPYFGNLLAHIATNPKIDVSVSNRLLSGAKGMSFCQMCLLSVFGTPKRERLRASKYLGDDGFLDEGAAVRLDVYHLLEETWDLWQKNWLLYASGPGRYLTPHPFNVIPSRMMPFMLGQLLFEMMDLEAIGGDHLDPIVGLLSWDGDIVASSSSNT